MSKTCFLIRNVANQSYGGAESYQIELARILRDNQYDPIIVTNCEELLKIAQKENFKTIRAPYIKQQNWSSWRNALLPVYYLWQKRLYSWYKKQINAYRPIAIDVQSRDDWIAATKAGRDVGVKIFWTDHIDFRTWVLQNVNQKFKNSIGKSILKLVDVPTRIFMISDFERQAFEKTIAPRKLNNILTLTNGVKDELKTYASIEPQKQSFCYVGRLVDYKGIKELIEAFKMVLEDYPVATLNIYGTGPDEQKYREIATNISQITFHGYTKEPLKAIAESEIFVLPSYYEGLSMSLLDAAMLQKPIIATNIDGNPEVVEDHQTGLLVPSKNSKKLAAAMCEMLENPKQAQQFAKNARARYEQKFNFEQTIKEKFLPLLED